MCNTSGPLDGRCCLRRPPWRRRRRRRRRSGRKRRGNQDLEIRGVNASNLQICTMKREFTSRSHPRTLRLLETFKSQKSVRCSRPQSGCKFGREPRRVPTQLPIQCCIALLDTLNHVDSCWLIALDSEARASETIGDHNALLKRKFAVTYKCPHLHLVYPSSAFVRRWRAGPAATVALWGTPSTACEMHSNNNEERKRRCLYAAAQNTLVWKYLHRNIHLNVQRKWQLCRKWTV